MWSSRAAAIITDKGRKNGAVTEDELPYPLAALTSSGWLRSTSGPARQNAFTRSWRKRKNGQWRVTLTGQCGQQPVYTHSLSSPSGRRTPAYPAFPCGSAGLSSRTESTLILGKGELTTTYV